jgi:hypothetical protein
MQQQLINATWRAEALLPLLWSLGRVSEMQPPTALCDVQALRRALPPLLGSVAEFVSTSRLLPSSAIHDANDEIYHIHWKVRDTQLNNKPIPDSYVPGVAKERHYALNWLICYFDQDWDGISTDT